MASDRRSSGNSFADCFGLLRLLADGRYHSADSLAAALGCSRDALGNRLRDLERLEIRAHASRGDGYRLSEPLDLIDRHALAALMVRSRRAFRVEVLDQCDSTNKVLAERASNGASHASVIVCEHQTAGRGRRGAQWMSWIGGSLSFSLLWRFASGVAGLSGLSLAVAVAVARALESLGARAVALKWPNDLLLGEQKLGGILIEMSGDARGPSAAVIGVGINVRLPGSALERIGAPVSDLASAGEPPSRTVLLARLLEQMGEALEQFGREGFGPFRQEWTSRHAWQGKQVALKVADRSVAEGEAVGVNDDGALLLRSSRGVERFHAGELSLRRA